LASCPLIEATKLSSIDYEKSLLAKSPFFTTTHYTTYSPGGYLHSFKPSILALSDSPNMSDQAPFLATELAIFKKLIYDVITIAITTAVAIASTNGGPKKTPAPSALIPVVP
jgi:hypothetical protein